MNNLLEEIKDDFNWRTAELASIKTIPFRYNISEEHKLLLIRYSIPSIYSLWEGFVKTTFTLYSTYLNRLHIKRDEIAIDLLTHQIDSICQLNNPRIRYESKKRFVIIVDEYLKDILSISPNVPTESNVNYKVINGILERFCIAQIDEVYENKLNKLVAFRNKIAHGENAIKVEKEIIEEFIKTISDLMVDIILNIEKACIKKTFLR